MGLAEYVRRAGLVNFKILDAIQRGKIKSREGCRYNITIARMSSVYRVEDKASTIVAYLSCNVVQWSMWRDTGWAVNH